MSDFMEQIREDIQLIKRDYGHLDDKIQGDDFAFNYWVLSRLFGLDEEVASSYVTDIHDKGIDCFVHYEDTKELYLIQNKFYGPSTAVKRTDASDFLKTPLSILLSGTYTRSDELQRIFDRAYGDSEYKIWLHFYVTNDLPNSDVEKLFTLFECHSEKIKAFVGAKFYKLSDIKSIYYGDRFTNKTSFTAKLTTRVSGTSLDVRPKDYNLDWMIDLRFTMVNVVDLYKMYLAAQEKNYELFEENVREYLGTKGINNGIIKTLRSPTDRENFFYYNNGITIICEKCDTLRGTQASNNSSSSQNQYGFKLKNPQIVNGCQTINSIAEELSHYDSDRLYDEFGKVFVLVKIYVFDEKTKQEKGDLDKQIVRYTNSQNAINEKAFASKRNFFSNIQNEFLKRGFLLLVKPSDKDKFSKEYNDRAKFAEIRGKAKELLQLFDLDDSKLKNYMIPLEKLLKVFLAFNKNGYFAFHKGSSVLIPNSPIYNDFSLHIDELFTIDNMIKLFLLFSRAESDQKQSQEKRFPIPYYVIGFLGKEFKDLEFRPKNDKLKHLFSNKDELHKIYEFYKLLTESYTEEYSYQHNEDYNKMIKQDIDNELLLRVTRQAVRYSSGDSVKRFLNIR